MTDSKARQISEIKKMIEGFNCQKHSIGLFLNEVIKHIDNWNLVP